MKILQTMSVTLALLGGLSVSNLSASASAVPADVELTFHLFSPIPKDHTQARLAAMRARVAQAVRDGAAFNQAFMKEVKVFILEEVSVAVKTVAAIKKIEVDADKYAEVFVEKRLGSMLDENQDPHTLPLFAFTYYVTPYLVPIFMRTGLPAFTRDFSALTLIDWAHSTYLFLDYVEKGCQAVKQGMAAAGLKPA